MKKILTLIFVLTASVALAQTTDPTPTVVTEDTSVTFPIGLWVSVIADFVQNFIAPFIGVAIGWILLLVPGWARILLGTVLTDRNVMRAIQYALNQVEGATRDKVITVDVGNRVVAEAVQYLLDSLPGWLVKFMGGEAGIAKKVIARLPNVDESASFNNFNPATARSAESTGWSPMDPRSPNYRKPT